MTFVPRDRARASGLLRTGARVVLIGIVGIVQATAAVDQRQGTQPVDLIPTEAVSPHGVVVTSSGAASRAGTTILEQGGNAVDAAVAAAFALGASEPGASGLGGQTLMLLVMADGRAIAIDGAAAAPVRLKVSTLRKLEDAGLLTGYPAAATPGTVAALSHALERYGSKTLAEVLQPAIEIAEFGSTMTPCERSFVGAYQHQLAGSPYLCQLFLRDCFDVFDLDHLFCLPDLARTLRRLAVHGTVDFYGGAIAAEIDADMTANGGFVSRDDLALMKAIEREPVRGSYRGLEVISFPFPGGGAAVVEALQILECFPPALLRSESVDRLHLLIEAVRVALADIDPNAAFARTADSLAGDKRHAAQRAALIRFDRALWEREIGEITWTSQGAPDTTQVSVADAYGNVVSLTQSLGRHYGGFVAAPSLGFPYNSLLENYSLSNQRSRNFPTPLRRAYSTMAPTVVLREGHPFLVLGSVASGRITSAIVAAIVNVADRGLSLCDAVSAPRVLWSGDTQRKAYLEIAGPITDEQADALAARGFSTMYRLRFPPRPIDLSAFGAVNSVEIRDDGVRVGVGDSRRQGVAVGARR